MQNLHRASIRILIDDKNPRKPVGAGFLITPNLILSCAHVVLDALGLPLSTEQKPQQSIFVDFPFIDKQPLFIAEITDWYFIKEQARMGDIEDLVLLALAEPILNISPLPLVALKDYFNRKVKLNGFPEGMDEGISIEGDLKDLNGEGRVQIDTEQGRGEIAGGFSGSAVYDLQENAIVGLVVSIDTYDGNVRAYMIPAVTILKAFPILDGQSRRYNPYKDLFSFTEKDVDFFFGREQATEELQQQIKQKPFVTVLGASGNGKSSVVQAGLVPRLKKQQWKTFTLRLQREPFKNLSAVLLPALYSDRVEQAKKLKSLPKELRSQELRLSDLLPMMVDQSCLIIIDQFEELFTLNDTQMQQDFLRCLLELINSNACVIDNKKRIVVLVTLRADFMAQALKHNNLAHIFNQNPAYILTAMKRAELEDAIIKPAAKQGVKFEEGLVTHILKEIGTEAGRLPLLQFALTKLWEAQQYQMLTFKAYWKLGGLEKALALYADDIWQSFNEEKRLRLHHVFVQLVRPGLGTEDTRQIALRCDIEHQWDLVQILADKRLVVTGHDNNVPTVEIVHEALIRHWQRLKGWMQEDRSFRVWQNNLRVAIVEWQRTGQDTNALLRGARLAEAEERLLENINILAISEQGYIKASLNYQNKEDQKKRRFTRLIIIGLSCVMVLISGLATLSYFNYLQAKEQKQLAEENGQLAESERKKSRQQLFDSLMTHASLLTTSEDFLAAKNVLKESYSLDDDVTKISKQARNLLSSFSSIKGGEAEKVYRGANFPLKTLAVSPEGRLLAVGGEFGTLVLFDVQTGELLQRLEGHKKIIKSVVFTSQGDYLLSTGNDKQIIIWQRQGNQFKLYKQWQAPEQVNALAIHPEGHLLATGGEDNVVTLWDFDTNKVVRRLIQHSERISMRGLNFNAKGNLLASASYDNTAIIWEVSTGKALQVLTGHSDHVYNVVFNADSKIIATSSKDKTVRLWHTENGQLSQILTGHQKGVFTLTFIANSHLLVSAGFDKTIRLWDTSSGVNLRLLQGHDAEIHAIRRYGSRLFSVSNDTTVRRWSLILPHQQQVVLQGKPISNAISPNLNYIAVGFEDGALRLYDSTFRQTLWENPNAHQAEIKKVTFNLEGNLLASGSIDKSVKIWDVKTTEKLQIVLEEQQTLRGHIDGIQSISFSPNNQFLATASSDGDIGLFPLNNKKQPVLFPAHQGGVININFDNSGGYLLSTGIEDGHNKLWDLAQPSPLLLKEFPQADDMFIWSNLIPNNSWLASVGHELAVTVYNREIKGSEHLLEHEPLSMKNKFKKAKQQKSSADNSTNNFWNDAEKNDLFSSHLPTFLNSSSLFVDFDFRCQQTHCLLAIPLNHTNQLMLYRLSYNDKLEPIENEQRQTRLNLWQDYLEEVDLLIQQNALSSAKLSFAEANSIGDPLLEKYPNDTAIQQMKNKSNQLLQQLEKPKRKHTKSIN